jgi:hypothetical protein
MPYPGMVRSNTPREYTSSDFPLDKAAVYCVARIFLTTHPTQEQHGVASPSPFPSVGLR